MEVIEDPIWETNDGREIPLSEMYTSHIQACLEKLGDWKKEEEEPARRKDLRDWHKLFTAELERRKASEPVSEDWLRRRDQEMPVTQLYTGTLVNLRRQLQGNRDPAARARFNQVCKELRLRREAQLLAQ
jgi:hypothetical protein